MDRDMLDQILASQPAANASQTGADTDPRQDLGDEDDPIEQILSHLCLQPYHRVIDRSRMHPNNRDLPWVIELEAMESELVAFLAESRSHIAEQLRSDQRQQERT